MAIKLRREQFKWTNGRGHNQKPILYSQKTNTYGLGKKEHNSDQWWTTAFDNQLKSLDVSSSSKGEVIVKQTATATPLSMERKSRYYIRFVPGGVLAPGIAEKPKTMGKVETNATATPVSSEDERKRRDKTKGKDKTKRKDKSTKRKSKKDETVEERKERKKLKRMVAKEMAILADRA
ncbi:hypothetical protein EDC01DRAFT_665039 [Geopyxis carbonaria]|nr:hypothetical protein EDC01DRAFT_665039 [Geopyxis carbonaria]